MTSKQYASRTYNGETDSSCKENSITHRSRISPPCRCCLVEAGGLRRRGGRKFEAEGSGRRDGGRGRWVGIIVGPGSLSSPLLLAPFRDNGQRAAREEAGAHGGRRMRRPQATPRSLGLKTSPNVSSSFSLVHPLARSFGKGENKGGSDGRTDASANDDGCDVAA